VSTLLLLLSWYFSQSDAQVICAQLYYPPQGAYVMILAHVHVPLVFHPGHTHSIKLTNWRIYRYKYKGIGIILDWRLIEWREKN
jgi:hypothetical protein